MAAATNLRLVASPDPIELDKPLVIFESSLIQHSLLLGREVAGLNSRSFAGRSMRICEWRKATSSFTDGPDANCGTTSSSEAPFSRCNPLLQHQPLPTPAYVSLPPTGTHPQLPASSIRRHWPTRRLHNLHLRPLHPI